MRWGSPRLLYYFLYQLNKYLEERKRQKQHAAIHKFEWSIRTAGLTPTCRYCKSNARMKLISWKDKETGMPNYAWKCLACNRWHYPETRRK